MLNKTQLLFIVILVEGYVVLACELLAIRQLIPFVGSGTEVISIIISAVLLPLAVGYHYGGSSYKRQYQKALRRGKKPLSVRKVLLRNIISALVIFMLGLSYLFMEVFFSIMTDLVTKNRLLQTFLFSALFLVMPVFMLGQTVPLVSNYFSRRKLSEITGKMLFFSTAGSFLGSVFSTIVLMTTIGVHNTVIVTLGLLCILALMLQRSLLAYESVIVAGAFSLLWALNNNGVMKELNIVSNNSYNMVRIIEEPADQTTIMEANRSYSSKISKDPANQFEYITYIQSRFIDGLGRTGSGPSDVLVIGAGGFTVGLNDTVNNYVYVDIDKDLKHVAEQHFLKRKLTPNKQFAPVSARAFVHSDDKTYDLIILDAYTNMISIPMECTTREFLLDVKKRLKPGGIVVANVISSPALADKFSVRYSNTFASVFPVHTRQVIGNFNGWSKPGRVANVLYIYYNNGMTDDRTVYTDDLNTFSLDRN